MSIQGVSGISSQMISSLVDLNNQLDDLQQELGTGKASQTYAGLGVQRGLTVGLQQQVSALSGFDDTITAVGTQLSVAQTALQGVATSADAVKQSAVNSKFVIDQTGQTSDQENAQGQLDQMLGALNTQVGSNYIFSGMSPDKPSVASLTQILNGSGTQAGFKQVLSERQQADGVGAQGRLTVASPAASQVSITENAVGSPFGMKLASVTSGLTGGGTVSGPSGPPVNPNSITVDFTGGNPAPGDTVKFTFTLPDGTSQDMTLTATNSSPPAAGQFTIGATTAQTATNFQAALSSGVSQIADTSLYGASALAAGHDFFDSNPPMRVNGSPPSTASTQIAGTPANTVEWYTGENGPTPALQTATATIDHGQTVSYGMRANEPALTTAIKNVAIFAATTYSATDPNASAQYDSVKSRIAGNLDGAPGTQSISDIEGQIANAQTAMTSAQTRHAQTSTVLTNFLQSIEGVNDTQVGTQILALQTQLQASLQTTALLSKVSIVNYITA
ncbi:MAG TPA: flagellar biosynthesis protein FlgL [Xanthobacteraceae bacterium]|nr:flagellar biosynthesis protein FlgL [Xanthobacteraceae bacterium]